MNDELFERGLKIRKSVLGAEFVEKSIASADDFNMPMQRLTTEYCWGACGTRGIAEEDPQHAQPGDAVGAEPSARTQDAHRRRAA